jgi:hypothetical protein
VKPVLSQQEPVYWLIDLESRQLEVDEALAQHCSRRRVAQNHIEVTIVKTYDKPGRQREELNYCIFFYTVQWLVDFTSDQNWCIFCMLMVHSQFPH